MKGYAWRIHIKHVYCHTARCSKICVDLLFYMCTHSIIYITGYAALVSDEEVVLYIVYMLHFVVNTSIF